MSCGALTVSVNARLTLRESASVTAIVTLKVPDTLGVPLIAPLPLVNCTGVAVACGVLSFAACSVTMRMKVATSKSSGVPSRPSRPALRRSM